MMTNDCGCGGGLAVLNDRIAIYITEGRMHPRDAEREAMVDLKRRCYGCGQIMEPDHATDSDVATTTGRLRESDPDW
jgi:hypothetical protein